MTRAIHRTRRSGITRAVFACSVMVLLTALGAIEAQAAVVFQAGDTVVKRVTAPRHPGVARLVQELSIGTVDGADEYTFSAIGEVVPLRDGSVLVLDGTAGNEAMLRRYDARGQYVRTIGRRGRGPGEFAGPGGLTRLPDGRILLLDAGGRRINVYDAAGRSVDTWNLGDYILSTGGTGRLRADSAGIVHLRVGIRAPNATSSANALRNRREAVLRLRPTGTVLDTIFAPDLPPVPNAAVTKTNITGSGSSSTSVDVPYMPQATWTWSPRGYMITGIPTRYAFELRVPRAGASVWRSGDPVISVRRSSEAVSVSREERADQRAYLERRFAAVPGKLDRAIPEIPREKPAYRRFLVGDDGRIWVALSTPSVKYDPESAAPPAPPVSIGGGPGSGAPRNARPAIARAPWREPAVYDVYEPDGTHVGQVAVPFDTRLMAMAGDIVWAATTDTLGVQYVKRFRIAWSH